MIKIFKKGFHILRKVIKSFQKRKTKGNYKDILKIYINKWKRILKQYPKDFYSDKYSINQQKENISPNNINIEEYNNNYEINYGYNDNFLKKNINFVGDKDTGLNKERININISLDSKEDFNNNIIISKSIEVIKRENEPISKKKNNKLNKRKSKDNKFDLFITYDRIIKKEGKKSNLKNRENLNKFYNFIKKINKKNEQKLIYLNFMNDKCIIYYRIF